MKRIICYNSFNKIKIIKSSVISLILKNKIYSLLTLSTIVGLIFGALSERLCCESVVSSLDILFDSNVKSRIEQPIFATFIISLTSSFIFIFTLILFGLSICGIVFIPLLPFIRGFGVGITAGYLYSTYYLKGILFNLIVLLPGIFLAMLAIILEAYESIIFSRLLFYNVFFKNKDNDLNNGFKLYIKRSGFIFIISVLSSFIDVILSLLFLRYFTF